MKLLNACRDYKSDSCIPEEIDKDLAEFKSKRNTLVFGKNEINVNKVKMPILDITSLGQPNKVFENMKILKTYSNESDLWSAGGSSQAKGKDIILEPYKRK